MSDVGDASGGGDVPVHVPSGVYGEEALAILRLDPRLQGMAEGEGRHIYPPIPARRSEARYVRGSDNFVFSNSNVRMTWVNKPDSFLKSGFSIKSIEEQPVFRESGPKPKRFPDAWTAWQLYICSQRLVDVLSAWDPQAFEAVQIDYGFADGQRPDAPFYLLELTRTLDVIDWLGTEFVVTRNGRVPPPYQYVYSPRGLRIRPDIDPAIHLFRLRRDTGVCFSRELAADIGAKKIVGLSFTDLAF